MATAMGKLPSPLAISFILTFFTAAAAVAFGKPAIDAGPIWEGWFKGVWNSPMLAFAFQMMFMLALGHVIALTPPVRVLVGKFSLHIANAKYPALYVAWISLLTGLLNWGMGLIIGAVLARSVAQAAQSKGISLNYPLVGATGYLGLLVWHGGWSGSVPLLVASEGHFLSDQIGVISIQSSILSPMNLTANAILFALLSLVVIFIHKSSNGSQVAQRFPATDSIENDSESGKMDHRRWPLLVLGLFGLAAIGYSLFQRESIGINWVNTALLSVALLCSGNLKNFSGYVSQAISGTAGILIQFPIYFGIMGMLQHAGLAVQLSEWIIENASTSGFPFATYVSAGVLNMLIPSGGGQWAIQGPIIADAISSLGVAPEKAIMAMCYGDQLTNMLQPFWALPLLAITQLRAGQLLPYTSVFFCGGRSSVWIGTLVLLNQLTRGFRV